jgi:uncharacterized protein YrrD
MQSTEVQKDVDIGADVYGVDGKKLGKVTYVVVRPPEMLVTDIVVSTGGILGRDIVVPADRILDVVDGDVFLSIDEEELKAHPDYVEVEYEKPPPGWEPPPYFSYPPAAVLLPPTASIPELVDVRVNVPPGTQGIRKGMEVDTVDGHKVGTIDKVDIDLETDEVTGFVVKEGFLFARDTAIPIGDVKEIRGNKVILKLTKDQIDRVEREQRTSTD